MKNNMTKIPDKIKREILSDPNRLHCALEGQEGHICGGRITWEHCMIYAGKQIQEKWAIISLCERGHAGNRFQDAGTMNKEQNVWVALNQATVAELSAFPRAFPSYLSQRERLNNKYGPYLPKWPKETISEGIRYDILDHKTVDNLGIKSG
jgi:hypothetical protein